MKRICSFILLFCVILGSLTGCEKAQLNNYIATKNLTEDQKQIVDLLTTGKQKYLSFDVKTEELYKDIEFWMEIYKNGELIDSRPVSLHLMHDEEKALDGEFAVIINETPDFQ